MELAKDMNFWMFMIAGLIGLGLWDLSKALTKILDEMKRQTDVMKEIEQHLKWKDLLE